MGRWPAFVLFGLSLSVGSLAVTLSAQTGDAAKGKDIYRAQHCSLCHKVEGSGGTLGPDLSNIGAERTAEWLKAFLADPAKMNPTKKPNKMPPVKVTGDDLQDLLAYLSTLKKAK